MIRLYITPEGQQPYLLSFERAHVSVGSSVENDVRLQGQGISGRHFTLRRSGADVVIEDCNSRNGTYINRHKVTGRKILEVDDIIQVVGFQIRLVLDADARSGRRPGVKSPAAGASIVTSVGASAAAEAPQVARPAQAGEAPEPGGVDAARIAGLVSARAQVWHERADEAHLLRGEELQAAHAWASGGERVQPPARTSEQALVAASLAAARRQGRAGFRAAGTCLLAAVAGGWIAGQVLAGGPEAYTTGLTRWAVEKLAGDVDALRRHNCAASSAEKAAQAQKQPSPEAALGRATEALACVAEFGLRDTPAEQTVRGLLATTTGSVLGRDESPVEQVAVGRGGRTVAWGRRDGSLTLWDAGRALARQHRGDGMPLRALALVDEGGRVVAVGEGALLLWDRTDEEAAPQRLVLDPARADVGLAAIREDGRFAVLASASRAELWAYEVDAGGLSAGIRLGGLPGPAERLALSPDGSRVFAASGTTMLGWRVSGGRVVGKPEVFSGHAAAITAMSVVSCSEGQKEHWLISGDAAGEVRVWEPGGRKRTALSVGPEAITAVGATADCRTLVAGAARQLHVWDLRLKEPGRTSRAIAIGAPIAALAVGRGRAVVAAGNRVFVAELERSQVEEYAGHSQPIQALRLDAATGRAITGGADGTVRMWDTRASGGVGSARAHLEAPVRGLAALEDGRVLVAAGAEASLWRVEGVGPPQRLHALSGSAGRPLKTVALSPSGVWAATAADEASLVLWKFVDERTAPRATPVPTGGPLTRLAFSDDAGWLVGIGPETACAVNLRVEPPRCERLAATGEPQALVVVPGTHRVAIGGVDRRVRLHDLDTGATQDLGAGKGAVHGLATGGERWLAALGENADGRLWDLQAPEAPAVTLTSLGETRTGVLLFSPDLQWLVAGTGPKIVAWQPERLDNARVSPTLERSVTALAMTPDGTTLLSGDADGKVWVWDFARLDQGPRELGTHRKQVTHLALPAGGEVVISAGDDPTVHVWPLSVRSLRQLALRVQGLPQ